MVDELKVETLYIAIGRWSGFENTARLARYDMGRNAFKYHLEQMRFIPYVIITESEFVKIQKLKKENIKGEVARFTSDHRIWKTVYEYIENHMNDIEETIKGAKYYRY